MRRRDTVEQDLQWGPIKQKEIFFKNYSGEGEVHTLVMVFKYRVYVSRHDTTEQVWGVVGESFHYVEVHAARYSIEQSLGVKGEDNIIAEIERRFPGLRGIEAYCEFCRDHAFDFSIHEGGPRDFNLVEKYEKAPL